LDAFKVQLMPLPQRAIIKGDATCMSISAASIVAKVARDRMMCDLAESHPGYSFEQHKGYGTGLHQEALARLGVSPVHRRCYAPVKALLSENDGRQTTDDVAPPIVRRLSSVV
jgi:ribonuclease HII